MTGQDELAQLEAESDRLRSMIAYHRGSDLQTPAAAHLVAIGMMVGIVILLATRLFSGQINLYQLVLLVVFLALSAYVLTRKITIFGITFYVGDALALGGSGPPAGEPETLQRLAECEKQIFKLKAGRS
jgi:hypothetical protein